MRIQCPLIRHNRLSQAKLHDTKAITTSQKNAHNKVKNRSLRGHVLTGNECYTINIVHVIVDMLL